MEGSFTTIPLPFAKTIVLAVPRSIARSLENRLRSERGDQDIIGLLSGVRVNDALAACASTPAACRTSCDDQCSFYFSTIIRQAGSDSLPVKRELDAVLSAILDPVHRPIG